MTWEQKLEIWKLIASLLTPIAILAIGYFLNKKITELEHSAEHRRNISETRFQLYKEIGFKLNEIYSYFLYVGLWKELSARDIVRRKRELDRHMYTYRPIFTPRLFENYSAFISATFSEYGGEQGADATLRTSAALRREAGRPELEARFTEEDNQAKIQEAYREIIESLAEELGIQSRESERKRP